MKRIYIASAFAFLAGYAANDVIQALSLNVQPAHADVAGMGYYDLIHDYDFKRAVEYIIEDFNFDSKIHNIVDYCQSQGEGEYIYC